MHTTVLANFHGTHYTYPARVRVKERAVSMFFRHPMMSPERRGSRAVFIGTKQLRNILHSGTLKNILYFVRMTPHHS